MNNTLAYQVGGCDLGYPVYDHERRRLLLLFGDSFSSSGSFSEGWRSQTVAMITDLSFNQNRLPIDKFLTDGSAYAIPMIDGHHEDDQEMTKIPTGAVMIGNTIYVYHFSIRSWTIAEAHRKMNLGGLIKSTDGGCTWSRVPNVVFANHTSGEHSDYIQKLINEDINRISTYQIDLGKHFGYHFTSIYPKLAADGYVYLFGEASFDADGIKLARVLASQIEDFDAYEYLIRYEGDHPIFERGAMGNQRAHTSQDNYVIKEKSREISIVYNQYLQKWMLFKVSESGSMPEIVFYLASNVYGPYSERQVICSKQDPMFNGATVYAPLTSEALMLDQGKTIYFLLSQWLPIYNPMLMKLELTEETHD